MLNITKIAAVAAIVLSLGACQTNQLGAGAGALLGGAGGGFAANQFIGKGQGKLIATGAGALGGALLGGFLGNSLTLPYTNSNRIDQNQGAIYQNGQRIDGMQRSIDQNGNVVYMQPGNQNPYNCRVMNNYVVCND